MGLKVAIASGSQEGTDPQPLPFVPQLALTFINNAIASAIGTANHQSAYGATDFNGVDRSCAHMSTHLVTPVTSGTYHANTYSLNTSDNAGSSSGAAPLILSGTTPFPYPWFGSDGRKRLYSLLCLAGLTNYKIGAFTLPSAIGSFDMTDPGFDPDALIFFAARWVDADPNATASVVGEFLGWCCRDGTQGVSATSADDNTAAAANYRYQRTNACIAVLNYSSAILLEEASFVSMIPTGVRLNHTTTGGGTPYIYYVALKGLSATAYNFLVGSATGAFQVALPFTPNAHIFQTQGATPQTTILTDARHTVGLAVSSTSQVVRVSASKHAANPTTCLCWHDEAYCIVTPTFVGAVLSFFDKVAFVSNGYNAANFNCIVAGGSGRQVLGLALGDAPCTALRGGTLLGGKINVG